MILWPEIFLALLVVGLEAYRWKAVVQASESTRLGWTSSRKLDTRDRVRDLWYHGYDNYMNHAFPADELAPLSCSGKGPQWSSPESIAYNDVAGNFSLTLVDSLDSLIVLNDRAGFELAVRNVIDYVSFDVDTKPQVFETNIRVLGALLSAHIFASQVNGTFNLPWYRGQLLALAHDLGTRFLPAFATSTGIPYARTNLRYGVPRGESVETCTAGAGSLILEFATLSRLTGDDRFEKAAYKAFFALWNRRSDIGLVGNTIHIWTGSWLHPEVSGIGAGIDSFFEYALKWYILSGEHEFLDVWNESYAAIMRFSRSSDGFWYRRVNIATGDIAYYTLDSLSAFWPGLQVLAGDLESAIKSHMIFWQLWLHHSGLPEVWDMNYKQATANQFPLRPEFIESTWYLYRATRDPFYLDVGERILRDITQRAKVPCGLTGIRDLRTNARDDRMESFVLSETLKYLYLLFDEENPLHADDSNYVFTTEGHILLLDTEHLRTPSAAVRKLRRKESNQCPAYEPVYFGEYESPGLYVGVRSRTDSDYARQLIGTATTPADGRFWHSSGWCEVPEVDLFTYDYVLSADGKTVFEDPSPSAKKVSSVADGFMVNDVAGLRVRIVSRLDGKGYDISKIGPHTVHSGQIVYLNDPALAIAAQTQRTHHHNNRFPDIPVRFFIDSLDPMFGTRISEPVVYDLPAIGHTALFGGNPFGLTPSGAPLRFGHGEGVAIVRDKANPFGCQPYTQTFTNEALLVQRGECTFLEKLQKAQEAGASGVVVTSEEEVAINPSASTNELQAIGTSLDEVAMVVLRKSDAKMLNTMLDVSEGDRIGQVMMVLNPSEYTEESEVSNEGKQDEKTSAGVPKSILYLNGHALLNTRLLV
ncbi:alpha-mannosidase [Dentipellis sp. KUC8613]|nr:alpha-mannosidase [Dentipellis sp. KUC8613]